MRDIVPIMTLSETYIKLIILYNILYYETKLKHKDGGRNQGK
jgi:hypothetical protein